MNVRTWLVSIALLGFCIEFIFVIKGDIEGAITTLGIVGFVVLLVGIVYAIRAMIKGA